MNLFYGRKEPEGLKKLATTQFSEETLVEKKAEALRIVREAVLAELIQLLRQHPKVANKVELVDILNYVHTQDLRKLTKGLSNNDVEKLLVTAKLRARQACVETFESSLRQIRLSDFFPD